MIGIYDWFGYEVPIKERYEWIHEAGFDNVMLWWSDGFGRGEGYQQGVEYARNSGLFIENIHTPVMEQNNLSLDNLDGESVFNCYLQCVKDCHSYEIPAMVIHAPCDDAPINWLGLERVQRIADLAEQMGVNVAFENLRNIHNLMQILESTDSKRIGFCYDACHHANYASEYDLLNLYGNRLMALHLHDNGGERNQHQLPMDGHIDWTVVMKQIAATGYHGATTLEPMNWGYEKLSIQEFLHRAFKNAKWLEKLNKK